MTSERRLCHRPTAVERHIVEMSRQPGSRAEIDDRGVTGVGHLWFPAAIEFPHKCVVVGAIPEVYVSAIARWTADWLACYARHADEACQTLALRATVGFSLWMEKMV